MSNRIKIKNPFAQIERRQQTKEKRVARQQADDSATPRTFGFYRGADRNFEMYADKFSGNIGNK
tara:strand:- start:100 stop:291 length:192 start_codon:yes stop_codon:yes gene_type:complete